MAVGCALVLSACPGSSEGDIDLGLGAGDGGGSAGDGGDDAGGEDAGGGIFVDLADVVGGGDGTGTGAAQGIDMLTGAVATAQASGITFDLRAIGAAHGGTATRFTATAGIGTRAPFPENVVSFLVAVDDTLVFEERAAADAGSRFPIDVTIPEGATTLTLITAATGDIQGDWSFWGAPTVEVR
ncbi:MAG: NPCBM/NEW2 domain-containing protein [Myxococcota bacterium]